MTLRIPDPTSIPRLSIDLEHDAHPLVCQGCGKKVSETDELQHWMECDDHDRPRNVVVLLCRPCSDRLIEPHPRLYDRLAQHQPMPGSMDLCVECLYRMCLGCAHPDLKVNGGDGLRITGPPPSVAFLDGRGKDGRRAGWTQKIYPGPAVDCAGRDEKVI